MPMNDNEKAASECGKNQCVQQVVQVLLSVLAVVLLVFALVKLIGEALKGESLAFATTRLQDALRFRAEHARFAIVMPYPADLRSVTVLSVLTRAAIGALLVRFDATCRAAALCRHRIRLTGRHVLED